MNIQEYQDLLQGKVHYSAAGTIQKLFSEIEELTTNLKRYKESLDGDKKIVRHFMERELEASSKLDKIRGILND